MGDSAEANTSSNARYSTALSHLVLAGTSIYCLRAFGTHRLGFPQTCFGTMVVHSVIGVWRYGNPTYGDKVSDVYRFTGVLQDCFALPTAVTCAYLGYSYKFELSGIHAATGLLPLAAYLGKQNNYRNLLDAVITGNAISLAIMSALHSNYFGIAAAISYLFAHFTVGNDRNSYFNIPPKDLFNYCICFYAFFAYRALTD